MADRLQAARDYVAKKPTDRFGLYTLAMELRKARQWEECYATFRQLLQQHPAYGPAWYHLAMSHEEAGDKPAALAVLREGRAPTAASGDTKTLREIDAAADALEAELE